MPQDVIDVTTRTGNTFDVFERLARSQDRLAVGGTRIGEGFVRGERVIRTASQNIASSLLMAGDATSTFLVAASGLERVFKIGIGPTIGIAAGIKAFEVLHAQVQKTNDLYKDLKAELAKPLSIDPITAEADRKIDELTEKVKKLHDELEKPVTKTSGTFAALAGIAASALLPSILSRPIAGALRGLAPIGPAALREVTDEAMKRIDAIAVDRGQKILAAADKLHDALREAVQRFRTGVGNLFRDIGSGQFLKDQQQRNLENQQTQAGQDMVRQFEEDLAKGITLGPNAQAIVNAARAAAAKGGVGIQDILNADFSNLDMLSKYDFSGLAPLSNLTILIQ